MRVQAILNPRAGLKARRALDVLYREHEGWGALQIALTERPGHARELAEQAVRERAGLVLAVGGDGTVNEVAGGLLDSATTLGIVPVGSGNGLARALGIPRDPESALRALAGAVTRRMDVGLANGRPFLNVSGAGFDAAIGHEFHQHGRRGGRRGIWPYVRLSVRRVLSYRPLLYRLSAGAERLEARALVVAAFNGRQYGAGAVMAPRARFDDGLLDLVVLEAAPWWEYVLAAPRAFLGDLARFRRYRLLRTAAAVIESDGPFEHHRDGEPEPAGTRVELAVRPGALRVLVPRAVAEDPRGPFGPQAEP